MTGAILLVGLTLAMAPPARVAGAAPVRVFVQASEADETADVRELLESVKDLDASFADKKKTFSVVLHDEDAQAHVVVVNRTLTTPKIVFGPATGQPGSPGMAPPPAHVTHLLVKLTYGDETVEFKNKNSPFESQGGWRSAADDIVKQIDKWIAQKTR